MPETSDIQQLSDRLRDRLVRRYRLTEVGDSYQPFTLTTTGEPVGHLRVWTGAALTKVVDARLVVPGLGIDSVMLHAFAPSGSAVPHLQSDVVGLPGRLTVNTDLTPRVNLAVEPDYLDAVYLPLTEPRAAAYAVEGAEPVALPLRLLAFGSPWMTGVRFGPDRIDAVEVVLSAYLDRFCALIEDGVPPVEARDLADRDRRHRRAQFDAANDEVWPLLADVIGQVSVEAILDCLRDPAPPSTR